MNLFRQARFCLSPTAWRFASKISTKEMIGKPPVLPVVEKDEIPRLFELNKIEKGTYRADFHGHNAKSNFGQNVYGGLLFAQGLEAAQLDVPSGFLPTSFHSLFVSYPFSKYPIDYQVEHLRDGGTFCARSIKGIQESKVVFAGFANFSKPSETSIYHTVKMPEVPKPEDVMDFFEYCEKALAEHEAGKVKLHKMLEENLRHRLYYKPYSVLDVRPVDPQFHFVMEPYSNVPLRYWIKSSIKIDDPGMHRLIVCYLSDMYLVSAAILPHISQGNQFNMIASLDNTLWFHNYDFDANDFMLYEVHSPIADSGRAISHGKLWTRDGNLIASTSQEVLARFKGTSNL
ncbi:Acyl-coenzyme A thioesterase 8 [Aphelenchoides bicaudatus]|nr:Acyl-coenzyme A thioesterase 8 [Aphelenchoides bicaudatus]